MPELTEFGCSTVTLILCPPFMIGYGCSPLWTYNGSEHTHSPSACSSLSPCHSHAPCGSVPVPVSGDSPRHVPFVAKTRCQHNLSKELTGEHRKSRGVATPLPHALHF